MDLYRRAGAGRLAEVLGEPALDADRQMRTFGLARVAAQEPSLLRDGTRAMLRAYADGVNKSLEQHGEALPIEFVIFGYRPERWTALDSIVVARLQAYDAASNLNQELLRASLALRLGTDALATLMPDPAGRPAEVDQRAWSLVAPLLSASSVPSVLSVALPGAGASAGSNCWALSGARTATGGAILAGDPHLAIRNPSIWYEIGLEGAGYKLVGFSFAGVPGIAIGHNAKIAWSLTYAYADTQDLFVERPDPADPRRFEYRGAFEPATIVRETIAVKGRAEPVLLNIAVTRHGPIVTPVLKNQSAQLALRWTALDPGRLLDFVYLVASAGSWTEFRAAAANFVGAAVSACYADVDGHIGYQLIGRLPERPGDARRLVADWDGSLAAGSAAAAIYETWLVRMLERTFKDKLGPIYTEYLEKGRAVSALYQLVGRADDPWFAAAGDASSNGRDALSGRALDDAVGELQARLGADVRSWRWGALHTIAFEHPLAIGPLALVFNIGPLARPGDGFSVNNGGYQVARPYRLSNHPSERMIADLADLDRSLSITPEGESGQPGSRFRGDQTPLWDAGEYKPMRFSRDRLGGLEGTLVFRPR